MKPTAEQDILLKKYLREVLRYRETYEEVYDHVLTALERDVYTGTLEEAVNQILREDFGGYDQLQQMESKAKKSAIAESNTTYIRFYFSYFNWPKLPYTLLFGLILYFSLSQISLSPAICLGVIMLAMLSPAVLAWRRNYRIGYLFTDIKKSIRDDVFVSISSIPNRLFVFLGIGVTIQIGSGKNILIYATPTVLTILYTLLTIYILSLIKLYRHEFKTTVTV